MYMNVYKHCVASGKLGMAAVSRRLARTEDGVYIELEHTKRYAILYALWTTALVTLHSPRWVNRLSQIRDTGLTDCSGFSCGRQITPVP